MKPEGRSGGKAASPAQHRVAVGSGQGNRGITGTFLHVGDKATRIGADHGEVLALSAIAMGEPRGNYHDIAGLDPVDRALGVAQLEIGPTGVAAQALMRGCVVMVPVMDAVAPRPCPAVRGEGVLEPLGARLARALVDQRPAQRRSRAIRDEVSQRPPPICWTSL